ncbi:MAG: laminin B domain-containing protein [Myxococcota bacterium]
MRTSGCLSALLMLVSAFVMLPAQAGQVLAESTFDSDDEGWSAVFFNTVVPLPVAYADGAIYVVDADDGDTFYWNAPLEFLGNKSTAYGGKLRWTARDIGGGTYDQDNSQVVMLGGMVGSSFQVINCPCPLLPGAASYQELSVTLSASGSGCFFSNGSKPTASQFTSVLRTLSFLQIKAEYLNGADEASMDHVLLETP